MATVEISVREVVAANVRARVAWKRIKQARLEKHFRWSSRTAYNKLHGITGFTDAELQGMAELLDLEDPGPLFSVPPSFPVSVGSPKPRTSSICRGDFPRYGLFSGRRCRRGRIVARPLCVASKGLSG